MKYKTFTELQRATYRTIASVSILPTLFVILLGTLVLISALLAATIIYVRGRRSVLRQSLPPAIYPPINVSMQFMQPPPSYTDVNLSAVDLTPPPAYEQAFSSDKSLRV